MRTGTANLPLHGGKCPPWLFAEMKELGSAIVQSIIFEYGAGEVLRRLSDPFWFQSLGCVLGFDWHSSGVTTTVCGALKEGLREHQGELGIFFAGGKGKTSRKTPMEIDQAGDKFALNNSLENLKYASRMAAKIDNNALQDGFQIYHHFFVFTRDGEWTVIQQGMNEENRYARRYHWLSSSLNSYVCDPHFAVSCDRKMPTLNLVASESAVTRDTITALSLEPPDRTLKLLKKISESPGLAFIIPQSSGADSAVTPQQLSLFGDSLEGLNKIDPAAPSLTMPAHHYVPRSAHITRALEAAYTRQPDSFETLVGLPGVGGGSLRALSLVAEIIHGVKPSYRDPVRYSFTHGGKDGHPFPVDRETYRNSIGCLEKALRQAKVGDVTKMKAFRKLAKLQELV